MFTLGKNETFNYFLSKHFFHIFDDKIYFSKKNFIVSFVIFSLVQTLICSGVQFSKTTTLGSNYKMIYAQPVCQATE